MMNNKMFMEYLSLKNKCANQHGQLKACARRIKNQRKDLRLRFKEMGLMKRRVIEIEDELDIAREKLKKSEQYAEEGWRAANERCTTGMTDQLAECRWALKRALRENDKLKRKLKSNF